MLGVDIHDGVLEPINGDEFVKELLSIWELTGNDKRSNWCSVLMDYSAAEE